MRIALLDPRLAENSRQFFPSWCTIYDPNATRNAFNELEDGTPSIVTGLDNIRCLLAYPTLRGGADEQETRTNMSTYPDLMPQVNLDGYYPDILLTHIARVDGVDYNIRSVVSNSTKTLTKLRVENIR